MMIVIIKCLISLMIGAVIGFVGTAMMRTNDAVNSIDNLDVKAKGGIYFKLMGLPPAEPEIIYCKDCIHYYGEPGNPNIICFQMHENDFCSYGKRREE